jgi:hypothetical protein
MQENQQLTGAKGETMAKRKQNKVTDPQVINLGLTECHQSIDEMTIEQLKRVVGSEIFAAAQQQAGANASLADIERILAKMLA